MDYCKDERPWYISEEDWTSIQDAIGCTSEDPYIIGPSIEISVGAPPGNPWWQVQGREIPTRVTPPSRPPEPAPPTPEGSRADVPIVVSVFQESSGLWAVKIGNAVYGALTEAVARRIAANERRKELTVLPSAPNYNPTPAVAVSQTEDPPVGIIEDITGAIESVGDVIDVYNRTFNPPDMTPPRPPPVVMDSGGGGAVVVSGGGSVVGGGGGAPGMYWSPRANCGAGKWIKYRRKRRRLLSESDYNALLRIETLKVNKNMTMAIGKALTR